MPEISIIIPCHNQGKYITQCLDSILAQTFSNYEVLIIDDGSTDNSLQLIESYFKKFKHIRLISQKNLGVVAARNNAIRKATAPYIYPLDADDIITPDCLEKLYEAMIHGKGDIITSRVMLFGLRNEEACMLAPTVWNMLFQNCLVNSALFRKSDFEKVGGYDHAFDDGAEDYDLYLNMIINQKLKIYRVPEILFYYRQKDISESRDLQSRLKFSNISKNLNRKYFFRRITPFFRLLRKIRRIFFKTKTKNNTRYIRIFGLTCYQKKINPFPEEIQMDPNQVIPFVSAPIVSLTSFPARINEVHHTIQSLLSQTFKPLKVILWLSSEEFPQKEKELPISLTNLVSKKFEIKWFRNIRSYKKLIPTLQEYPQNVIVTADDDVLYPPEWLNKLWQAYLQYPHCIIAHRIHQVKLTKDKNIAPYNTWAQNISCFAALYQNFLTGVGGVLYPPKSLHPDVFKEEVFMKICAKQDDIWFWAMALLNHTPIKQVKNPSLRLDLVQNTQTYALCHENCGLKALNDKALCAVIKRYPEIKALLRSEKKPFSLFLLRFLKKIFSVHTQGGGEAKHRFLIRLLGFRIAVK